MSSEPSRGVVENLIREALGRYGKVGVLIDDANDAQSRIARELYGAEGLPAWWLQARSIECGLVALQAFLFLFNPDKQSHPYPGIVIIDRFLPVRDLREKLRPTAWDTPRVGTPEDQLEICGKMKVAVRDLLTLTENPKANCFCKVITSYPHPSLELAPETNQEEPIPWQARSIEVLFQFRRKLRQSSLLSYGPGPTPQFLQEKGPPVNVELADLAEAQWKARTWRESLRGLAEALAQPRAQHPIILFTGAGASRAEGMYGPGMPSTSWLLEETCRTLVKELRDRGDISTERKDCWHEDVRARSTSQIPCPPGEVSIDWLIRYLLADEGHRASELQCLLEVIFSRKKNKASGKADEFYAFFRSLLQRFDHGFPYHHWLLAQMPWTRIVTTNFDGFHDRAAAAAAATFEADSPARLDCLGRGQVFPISAIERADLTSANQKKLADLYQSCRLFKPYGNLLSPVELALGAEALERFGPRLKTALDVIEKAKGGFLVVVGHAMRDHYINTVLTELNGKHDKLLRSFELLWVDPESFRRCASPTAKGDQTIGLTWEKYIAEKQQHRETQSAEANAARISGPLPATALEFSYDLAIEYRDAIRRLRPVETGGI